MEYNIKLILNPKLYLKDPEKSELGRNIIKNMPFIRLISQKNKPV